ncbi:ABC transporter permease subunit [Epidermidibacterium keratini]|uniref:ABC-type polar-amino-acid transporter n=2 Tax=Epidermidibacterium keratini TaxID=1891644 RepID=A0A7L4YT36_9ACTN|nr:ABC transporter permease subunit [Epidermidibacterium keratini]
MSRVAGYAGLLFLVVFLSSCSSAASSALIDDGRLTVGSDLTYPPYAYLDGDKPAGFDPEFATAVADEMGLEVSFKDTRFEQLINGVKARQFDMIASALYVTEERAKSVIFVPYFTTGNSIVAPATGGYAPSTPIDLCGRAVAVIKGGQVVQQLREEASAECEAAGQPAIDVREFTTDPEGTSALRSGQVAAQVTDAAVAKTLTDESGGALAITSAELIYPVPVGLAVNNDNAALAKDINDAIAKLEDSGQYEELLTKYNLQPVDQQLVDEALGSEAQSQKAALSGAGGDSSGSSYDWAYMFSLFGNGDLWMAALVVVALSVSVWVISTFLGLFVALAKQSPRRWVRTFFGIYVWFFRSLPLLVLLIFVYNAPQIFPGLRSIVGNPFVAGLIAMVLSETAYIAEIHRGGLLSVGEDQREAGRALGLRHRTVIRRIVVPQAFRVALPALGNEFVTILKLTSLVSAISLAELLLVGQRLYTQNFKVLETLTAVAIYYVLLVTIFDQLRNWLERRLDVRRRRTRLVDDRAEHVDEDEALRAARERVPHEGDVVLRIADLEKSFGEAKVLDEVNLDVHAGEVVAIIGPSGSGKTTLIRTMNHLESVDDGRVELDGELVGYRIDGSGKVTEQPDAAVAAQRRRVGMVFQRFNLFPHMSVLDNLTLAPVSLGLMNEGEAKREAERLLDKVGMAAHRDKFPYQLSGGQQQRVAIARALAMQPEVLLFDEPTSALDPELVGEVLEVMTNLARDGMTMVVVTHEMKFARKVADWIVFMDGGRIIDQGPPESLLDASSNERIRSFMRRVTGD